MAANDSGMMSELREITECCICSETFTDARMLPCIHTFCLKCLQNTGSQTKKNPGDSMPCPLCRREFTIPTKGWMDLQKNFFMERLIEMTKVSKISDKGNTLCDICKADSNDSTAAEIPVIPPATMYCMECKENLCQFCAKQHKRQTPCKGHRVVAFGSELKEEELVDRNMMTGLCHEHSMEQLKVYCFDCKTVVCILCFIESHQSHKCSDVNKVVDDFKRQIRIDIDKVSEYSTEGLKKKEELEKERMNFIQGIETTEKEIRARNEELKQLVDEQTNSLLEELFEIKEKRLKEMENEKEEMDRHLVIMDSFKIYCKELESKGSPGDICRTVNDLQLRANELKQLHESDIQQKLLLLLVRFEKTDLDNIPAIGNIVEVTVFSTEEEFNENCEGNEKVYADLSLKCVARMDSDVCGVAKLLDNIYALRENPTSLGVYEDKYPFALQSRIEMKEVIDPWDITASEMEMCLYITDKFHQCIWKMAVTDHRLIKWLSGIGEPFTLSVSSDGNVLVSRNGEKCSLEIYASDASLVQSVLLPDCVNEIEHAVKTSKGTFVMLHDLKSYVGTRGVYEVDSYGSLIYCFNPINELQEMNNPLHLVSDSNDRMFVADCDNNRVILLDAEFESSQVILNLENGGIVSPGRLIIDKKTNQFIVFSFESRQLAIYELNTTD